MAQVGTPSLGLAPDSGPAGTRFTVAGSNHSCFTEEDGGRPRPGLFFLGLFVVWDEPAQEVQVDPSNGSFTAEMTVPSEAAVAPGGAPVPHRVHSECRFQGELIFPPEITRTTLAEATFTVTPAPSTPTTTATTSTTVLPAAVEVPATTSAPPVAPAIVPPVPADAAAPPTTAATAAPPPPQVLGREVEREGPAPPERRRSAFADALREPTEVSLDLGLLATNGIGAGAVVLLFAVCSELFNKTVEENYDEIQRWLAPLRRVAEAGRHAWLRVPTFVSFGAVAALAALLAGFLDPDIGLDRASLALVVGLGVSFVVVTLAFEVVSGAHARRRGAEGYLRVFPAALLVAVPCVVLSRLAHFQPGYLFGVVAGYAFIRGRLSEEEEGKGLGLAAAVLLSVCTVCWFAWVPLNRAAGGSDPGFFTLVGDATLAGVFVAGLESLLFELMPLRFLDGQKIKAWSRLGWTVLFTLTLFGFLQVMLRPEPTGYAATAPRSSLLTAGVLFAVFALGSVGFWAFFRLRPGTPAATATGPTIDLRDSPLRAGGDGGDGAGRSEESDWRRAMEGVGSRS